MDVRCGKCNLDYGLDLEHLDESGFSLDCANCGVVVQARRRLAYGTGAGRRPAETGDDARRAPHQWYLRPAGSREPRFCQNATILQEWIVSGVVTRDWDISNDASGWKPMRGIAELQPLFDRAEADADSAVITSAPAVDDDDDNSFEDIDTVDDLEVDQVEVVDIETMPSADNLKAVDNRNLASSGWALEQEPAGDADVGTIAEPVHTLAPARRNSRPWLLRPPGALLFLTIGALAAYLLGRGAYAEHPGTPPSPSPVEPTPPPQLEPTPPPQLEPGEVVVDSTASPTPQPGIAPAAPARPSKNQAARTSTSVDLDYRPLVERADRSAARGARAKTPPPPAAEPIVKLDQAPVAVTPATPAPLRGIAITPPAAPQIDDDDAPLPITSAN